MKKYRKEIILSFLLGIVTAVCFEVGARIGAEGALRYGGKRILINIMLKTMVWMFAYFSSWIIMPKLFEKFRFARVSNFLQRYEKYTIPFILQVVFIALLWVPAYLAIFPGAYAYDAPTQWEQFCTGNITTHHPVLHTLFLGVCMKVGISLFSSGNVGIAIYTIIQIILMACIFVYVLRYLKKCKCPLFIRVFAFLFYGLSPVVHLFVVSSTKDTLFTGVLLLFLIFLIELNSGIKEFLENKKNILMFVLATVGTMLLRKNGFYVAMVILFLLLLKTCWLERKYKKKMLSMLFSIIALYFLVTGPIYRAIGVKEGNIGEMLSVPLQQMARTYIYHSGELDRDECQLLEQYVPREDIYNYVPTVADGVKAHFRDEFYRANKWDFWHLWIKWGMKYPFTYISSFLINTSDYWYPKAIIDGYNVGGDIISYSRYSVGEPGERVEMLPRVYDFYKEVAEHRSFSEKPLAFLILGLGWYLIMILYLGASAFRKGQNEMLLSYLAVFLLVATALLGPIAQVRYVLILFFAFPMFVALQFKGIE